MFRTPKSLFRTLAIAEAVSWTLLIAGLIIVGIILGIGRLIGKKPNFHEGEESPADVHV